MYGFQLRDCNTNRTGIETGQAISQVSLSGGAGAQRGPSSIVGNVKTQLIAHDKEVYDMAFSRAHKDLFASVGIFSSLR